VAGHGGRFCPDLNHYRETMEKAIFAILAAATLIGATTAAQAGTTTCQWQGYGQYKQWVCQSY
jgi:hypothetical protein